MRDYVEPWLVGWPLLCVTVACSDGAAPVDSATSGWESLMDDGASLTLPLGNGSSGYAVNRYCTDCSATPLAWWKFDFCSPYSTQLDDSATSAPILHPAFRAVGVTCVAGPEGQAVRLANRDDLVYSPDQPDYDFSGGLTVAAWVKPDSVSRTQSLVRKRLDGTSAFTLAIVEGRLEFVIRYHGRRSLGVAAPIEAGRFTHVAATYDGQEMRLYLGGTLHAQAAAGGEIATGAGPILVGNDATGRRFNGIIDEVWVNIVAAPPETIWGLNCARVPPQLSITPSTSEATPPNTPVSFDIAVTNPADPTFCPIANYLLVPTLPYPLSVDSWYSELAVAPGETAHQTVSVSASEGGAPGPVPFHYAAYDKANYALNAAAVATFVVAGAD